MICVINSFRFKPAGGGGGATVDFGQKLHNGTVPASGDRAWFSNFTVPADGDIISLHAWVASGPSGHCKLLVYADAGGKPGARLLASAAIAITATGEIVATVSLTGLTAGTTLWLGLVSDSFPDMGGESGLASTAKMMLFNGSFSYSSPPATAPTTNDGVDTNQNITVWATLQEAA